MRSGARLCLSSPNGAGLLWITYHTRTQVHKSRHLPEHYIAAHMYSGDTVKCGYTPDTRLQPLRSLTAYENSRMHHHPPGPLILHHEGILFRAGRACRAQETAKPEPYK